MATGKPLFAKLFLECKEVPFIGATMTSTVGQASIAYIDLVPHQTINNIKPRTLVHLMIRDFNNPAGGFPWIQMFEGEVFGYQFSKNPNGRNFSISCIDYSSYWDNALNYFFNPQQSWGKGSEALSEVGFTLKDAKLTNTKTQAVTHSTSSFFLKLLIENSQGEDEDFLSGLISIFKNLTEINDFYNLSEDRLRIEDRIILKSSGELQKLLRTAEAEQWLNKQIGGFSGYTSIRMVIQQLMSLIFHDFVSVPFPSRVTTPVKLKGTPLRRGTGEDKTIGNFIFKPNLYMMPPPSCNVFFPDEYASFQYSRNFFQEPTRLIYKPEMPTFFGNTPIQMPHAYEPDSFNEFMLKETPTNIGDGDLEVNEDFGKFADSDSNSSTNDANQGFNREWNFLTNEEKMKGILAAQEGMVPGVTQFRSSLTDVGRKELSESIARYLFFKKRFEGRSLQITSHMKHSVVPGFPVLILDDSEAEQSMVAYCSSVTHRIYANQGGFTNSTLSYARTVDEQDSTSESLNEPLIPPWFSSLIFGQNVKVQVDGDGKVTNQKEVDAAKSLDTQKELSKFYASLIGDSGSKVITDLKNKTTILQATKALLADYRFFRSRSSSEVQTFIAKITGRDYTTMRETFRFLGAGTSRKDLNTPFVEFFGRRISGRGLTNDVPEADFQDELILNRAEILAAQESNEPPRDADQIKARRAIIDKYRNILKSRRGFRG